MMKLLSRLLLIMACFSLAACQNGLIQTRADTSVRYGLHKVKLGDHSQTVVSALEQRFGGIANCENWQTGVGYAKRSFWLQKCQLVSDSDKFSGDLWGEKVSLVHFFLLEEHLIDLQIDVLKSTNSMALYERHGDRVLRLFGQPQKVSINRVTWQNGRDEVQLRDLKNGKIRLAISSRETLKRMHHIGRLVTQNKK